MNIINRLFNKPSDSNYSPFENLIDDITKYIISLLDERDKIRLSQTCKRFNALVPKAIPVELQKKHLSSQITLEMIKEYRIQKRFEECIYGKIKKIKIATPFKYSRFGYFFKKMVQGEGRSIYLAYQHHKYSGRTTYGIVHVDLVKNKWQKITDCKGLCDTLFFSKKTSNIIFSTHPTLHFLPKDQNKNYYLNFPIQITAGEVKQDLFYCTQNTTLVRINLGDFSQTPFPTSHSFGITSIYCSQLEGRDIIITGCAGMIKVWDESSMSILKAISVPMRFNSIDWMHSFKQTLLLFSSSSNCYYRGELEIGGLIERDNISFSDKVRVSTEFYRSTCMKHQFLCISDSNFIYTIDTETNEKINCISTKHSSRDFFFFGNSLYCLNGYNLREYRFDP